MKGKGDSVPVYTLIPDEHDFEPEVIAAPNAAQLLSEVYGFGWNSARVLQDDQFVFTLQRDPHGFWSILPRLPED
jgi:hypothetical protein